MNHRLWRITLDTNPEDCNLNCIMCEEHSPYSKFKSNLFTELGLRRREMPAHWLNRIFDEASQLGIREIIPSTMGEPTLYKYFDQIVDNCYNTGIRLNLTTNGIFPHHNIRQLASRIIPITSDIKFSVNGASKQIAENIMHKLDFDKQIENIKQFVIVRNRHFAEIAHYCRLTFQLTFMQNNMHELSDIIKLAASLDIDRVKGHHLWVHFKETEALSFKQSGESVRYWNELVNKAYQAQEKYLRPNGTRVLLQNIVPLNNQHINDIPLEYDCPFLNHELWISATGKISPCCAPDELRNSLGDFGNYPDVTIQNVVESDAYKQLVKNYKGNELCRKCNMRVKAE